MEKETICAIATGHPSGAISIIRVSGPKSIEIANQFFSRKIENSDTHKALFGLWKKDNLLIDEVLLTPFKHGSSFTGEESIEVACHASAYIVQEILNCLNQAGARMAEPGEFTLRAYMNGRMDLSQAEAVADVIASQNAAAHKVAMNQLRGGLSNELKDLREKLIHFASMVELELDFGEEDVEFADRTELLNLVTNVKAYVQRLIDSFKFGNAIKNGVPIALVGRPNAGKSTVLNALLQEERAIVSDIPGTTRDTVEEVFNHKGVSFRFMDTAGVRQSSDFVEQEGIKRSLEKIARAELVVYLFDASELSPAEVQEDQSAYLLNRNYLLIGTKKDKLSDEQQKAWSSNENIHLIYVKDDSDRAQLLNLIYAKSVGTGFDEQTTIISNARHVEKLEKALISLVNAETALKNQISGDFVAMDIRQAMYQIGQITGDISTDDLLGNIFAKFCIGK
ncbi:MAG: tRNA uridine-5-carboxymethylaminomethyl(34) synthesis GTPase MnmE [Crocinitomicaceae bacterium]|jgi:tRNA modification GTPase|nr:tRNA uridine-5-carboxymethylaminomethyl(34) synthesis GTPase MnmE [Crocinitomicaceae bacterium]